MKFTCMELCAGAGGMALGLERASFGHVAALELDLDCCATLRANRPAWMVINDDMKRFDGTALRGKVDLLAGGLPCPPFSIGGKQLGELDERNLFADLLRLVGEIEPAAVMIENVDGILAPRFKLFRQRLRRDFRELGYEIKWKRFYASQFGIPQARKRVFMVAMAKEVLVHFKWPRPADNSPPSVGKYLHELMAANGWRGARRWRRQATEIAPTIVGGSRKHGGPDLGPSRTRKVWGRMGVKATSLADTAPHRNFRGDPRLTLEVVAKLQGFPADWVFRGNKTSKYRQIGNALPPQMAHAVSRKVHRALKLANGGNMDSHQWDRRKSRIS